MTRTIRGLLVLTIALLLASHAGAWWDTVLTTVRPVQLVREIEAETCEGMPANAVVDDLHANGGEGGKAVRIEPDGEGLTTTVTVDKPGIYAIFTIARSTDGGAGRNIMLLTARDEQTGIERSWSMVVVYRELYYAVGQMYFPAFTAGKHRVTVKLLSRLHSPDVSMTSLKNLIDPESLKLKEGQPAPLLVDRLELRDALAGTAGVAAKTKRMLTTDEELAAKRKQFAEEYPTRRDKRLTMGMQSVTLDALKPLSAEERAARNETLWNSLPDFNSHVSNHGGPFDVIIGRNRKGLIADAASIYELSANLEAAWDASVLLTALALRWPAVDYFAQATAQYSNIHTPAESFHFARPAGKSVYRGWAGGDTERLVTAYDQLFDFIKDNQALANFVGTKVAWVKTPADVIKLLDVYLLQSSIENATRDYISGDEVKALIPLVQGVGPIADKMLDDGMFSKISMNMTFAGGIDDHALCSYNRDGVHYIGSTGYVNTTLLDIAVHLQRYRQAGGAARYDLLDEKLYPQMAEAKRTVDALRVAGGFPLVIGDAMDLRRGREAERPAMPSRLLGGFGASILESGQFGDNPLNMRAVGLYFGIGRGHAHQDTLNIELFAHGSRMAPDLGGRHEGKLRGSPNMRSNKVHNLVEVDERNFENSYAGSTTSATGWNTSFAPLPGAQFMEHAARATSHPHVKTYARQTVMIDAGEADSYLFDVFRVSGGKVHTYSFHGPPTEKLVVNTDLADPTDPHVTTYLRQHFEGTRRQGVAPAVLEADWALLPHLHKSYQKDHHNPDRVPTTRFSLFGKQGQTVMVGNAHSEAYSYNFPFLYVQSRQDEEGLQNAYPAIIEMFAGEPFITDKKQLTVTPASRGAASNVALQVTTRAGRTDVVYAGGTPSQASDVEGGIKVSGKFAMLSREGGQITAAQLVGGTSLVADGISITTQTAAYAAKVLSVDYPNRSLVVDQKLPTRLLAGAVVGLDTGTMMHNFKLSSLEQTTEGTRIQHEKTARYYQSAVIRADADTSLVSCEIEPPVFGPDTRFAAGTTVANESLTRFWKTDLVESDRWMHMGHPGYRGSYPISFKLDDFKDSDGDGKRIVRLMGDEKDKDADGKSLAGSELLKMEITRLSDDGSTLFFKLPEDERYQRGGWQFAGRKMYNEDNTGQWIASYPGSTFAWKLEGGFKAGDFTDADGDGKVKLSAYLYGPGDTLKVDSWVQVRRTSADEYDVISNVPCTVSLAAPARQSAEVAATDGAWKRVAVKREGDRLTVTLSEADLAGGQVKLRLK